MGGQSGETRGKSKIETYLKYERLIEGVGEIFQSRNPDPLKTRNFVKSLWCGTQIPGNGSYISTCILEQVIFPGRRWSP